MSTAVKRQHPVQLSLPPPQRSTDGFVPDVDALDDLASMLWVFPATELHAHHARRWFTEWLASRWPMSAADDVARAELAAAEVLANAAVHGVGSITFTAVLSDRMVRCRVGDDGPAAPVTPPSPTLDAESGRGLFLVDALVDTWTVHPEWPGKIIDFSVVRQSDCNTTQTGVS